MFRCDRKVRCFGSGRRQARSPFLRGDVGPPGRATRGWRSPFAVPRGGNHHRPDPRRDEGRPPDLPRAGRRVPAPHRRLRQERAVAQRHRGAQSERDERGGRVGSPLRARRPDRPAALRPDDREGQLRDDRTAERRRVAFAQGFVSNKDAFQVASGSRKPARSCSPSRTWPSSRSARTRR